MPFKADVQIGQYVMIIPAMAVDAPLIWAAWQKSITSRGWHHDKPATVEAERLYLQHNTESSRDCLFMIRLRPDREIIGTVGIHVHTAFEEHAHMARIGLLIFNTEAIGSPGEAEAVMLAVRHAFDRKPDLEGIYANIDVDDLHERTLYAQLGFCEARPGHVTELKRPDNSIRSVWMFEIRPAMLAPKANN